MDNEYLVLMSAMAVLVLELQKQITTHLAITQILQKRKKERVKRLQVIFNYIKEKQRHQSVFDGLPSRIWKKPTHYGFWEEVVPTIDEQDFTAHFRVDREIFSYLVSELYDKLYREDTKFREAVPVDKQVAIGLKTLATTSDYRTLAKLFGVGKTTVHDIFKRFLNAASEILVPKHIVWPSGDDYYEKALEFEEMWDFPMAFGAIGGCHFEVTVPEEFKTDFCNFKGWYSVIAIVVADANCKAFYVQSGIPGSCSASEALKKTNMYQKLEKGDDIPLISKTINGVEIPLVLLGDSSFQPSRWLLKPYINHHNLTDAETVFNHRLSRARRVVENLFGRLKCRWRRTLKCIECKLQDVPLIIDVSVALHNICEGANFHIDDCPENIECRQLGRTMPMHDTRAVSLIQHPDTTRNALAEYFAEQGQPWEEDEDM